jgi:hypothetical protein
MFIPIRVPGTDGALGPTAKRPSTEPPADSGRIEIVVAGGRAVRIGAGFDPATLRQVLGVLEG